MSLKILNPSGWRTSEFHHDKLRLKEAKKFFFFFEKNLVTPTTSADFIGFYSILFGIGIVILLLDGGNSSRHGMFSG